MATMEHKTSWANSKRWYDELVGQEGHYYHREVILPKLLPLITEGHPQSLIDLACGQGILSRHLPKQMDYLGLDVAANLIAQAQEYAKNPRQKFAVHDITLPYQPPHLFECATILLALQNISDPASVLKLASSYLKPHGRLILVLNHPCFRMPRQSSWGIDEQKKCQYRRLDRYLSPMEVPIQMQPGKGEKSTTTWSYHHPLQSYVQWLSAADCAIIRLEEWCSNKKSQGGHATMENRARAEFPLFLTLVAQKRGE